MTIYPDCQYYNCQDVVNQANKNKFDESEGKLLHNCNHPDNKPHAVTSGPCNIENKYCPYNPKNLS